MEKSILFSILKNVKEKFGASLHDLRFKSMWVKQQDNNPKQGLRKLRKYGIKYNWDIVAWPKKVHSWKTSNTSVLQDGTIFFSKKVKMTAIYCNYLNAVGAITGTANYED